MQNDGDVSLYEEIADGYFKEYGIKVDVLPKNIDKLKTLLMEFSE